jgi:hypothetical protein
VEIFAKSLSGEKVSVELKDVIYAPTFHTNVVSYKTEEITSPSIEESYGNPEGWRTRPIE